MTLPNPSTALATAVVDELSRHGVRYAVISPGSRSAALAIACHLHPAVESVVVLDERSASFRALGRAKATGEPVAVVVTSGTAVANLFPAVVEADLARVPLLVLTADRPPELLGVGANQTIDQVKLFGDKVRWWAQVPVADGGADHDRYWRSLVSQVVARSRGHGGPPGPVHLNVSFREPTVPVADDGRTRADPYPHPVPGRDEGRPWQHVSRATPGAVTLDLPPPSRALIVAGEGDYDGPALLAAAEGRGWPVLASSLSGLRRAEVVTTYHHLLVRGVPSPLLPDLVVMVGRVGPSDRLAVLDRIDGPRLHVDPWGGWHDPWRAATHLVEADPAAIVDTLGRSGHPSWRRSWLEAERTMRAALDDGLAASDAPTGPGLARAVGRLDCDRLVVASSMPVRDVDAHTVAAVPVVANRGASGIDGFVSTALGAASAGGRTLAMAGDLSLLHDLAGLVGERGRHPLVMVVVDNGGGGLFDLLPQADHAPGYERLFVAPHGLDLAGLTRALGVESTAVAGVEEAAAEAARRLAEDGAHVLVVPVDRGADLVLRRRLDRIAEETVSRIR